MKKLKQKIAIIGCGNIGSAIAEGLLESKIISPSNLYLTKRNLDSLKVFCDEGCKLTTNNLEAVKAASIVILAVTPQKMTKILNEISETVDAKKHIILSIATGVEIAHMKNILGDDVPALRVMPNTAIALKESMTCISAAQEDKSALEIAKTIFETVGKTAVISEDLMGSATSLVACGIAFFLRAIRAAGQGGTQIGFHAEDAILMAAQTAKGAASLLVDGKMHPEREIDKVTTPRGLTITGLNEMEHSGFSSAMIKGIVTAAVKADTLFKKD